MPMDTIIERTANVDETLADAGFYWRERDGVRVLVCRAMEDAGFANGFSTRLGGASSLEADLNGTELNLGGFNEDSRENIFENRRRFLVAFPGEYKLRLAWQVHGDNIRLVERADDAVDSDEHADALISDLPGVLVGVKTAYCVPLLIGDPTSGAFAAVHAGWRGTAQSIVKKAVAKLIDMYGSSPVDMISAIGPAAGCNQYEVGQDVIDLFDQNFATAKKYFTDTKPGHALVDLKSANRDQLIQSGVSGNNISIAPYCTMERSDLFFSYRLEKAKFGRTGRLLSVIGRL